VRISELAESTGVALPTLKYYLREGLLMPGTPTSRTRAVYDGTHVERVRLVRALIETGGMGSRRSGP
jgi:DNA-binding transcriptional MerR regulator